jgi:hypothetical protein
MVLPQRLLDAPVPTPCKRQLTCGCNGPRMRCRLSTAAPERGEATPCRSGRRTTATARRRLRPQQALPKAGLRSANPLIPKAATASGRTDRKNRGSFYSAGSSSGPWPSALREAEGSCLLMIMIIVIVRGPRASRPLIGSSERDCSRFGGDHERARCPRSSDHDHERARRPRSSEHDHERARHLRSSDHDHERARRPRSSDHDRERAGPFGFARGRRPWSG